MNRKGLVNPWMIVFAVLFFGLMVSLGILSVEMSRSIHGLATRNESGSQMHGHVRGYLLVADGDRLRLEVPLNWRRPDGRVLVFFDQDVRMKWAVATAEVQRLTDHDRFIPAGEGRVLRMDPSVAEIVLPSVEKGVTHRCVMMLEARKGFEGLNAEEELAGITGGDRITVWSD